MSDAETTPIETKGLKPFLRFLIPSVIGIILFLAPFPTDDGVTILFGIYSSWMQETFGFILLDIVVWVTIIAAIGSAYALVVKPDWQEKHPVLYAICDTSIGWFVFRVIGAAIGVMVLYNVGPEVFRLDDTGIAMFNDVGIGFAIVLFPACFLMPLLTEFGAMEFFGTFVAPAFRSLFKLPGRSAVDATASFISSSNIGVLVTGQQYRRGFYTGREAVTVATNFSVVSLPFALVIADVSKIGHMFFPWYLTAIVVCIACAVITPRIPPISSIAHTYKDGIDNSHSHDASEDKSLLSRCMDSALISAAKAPNPRKLARDGSLMFMEQLFGVLGPMMALATLSAIVAFHSPLGEIITTPIAWALSLFDVAEAPRVAIGFLFGYMDQFIPAVIAGDLASEPMRFILAGLSLSQLIYMSETGLVMMRVGLPITVFQLFQVFVIRTLVSIPVLVGAAIILF
ncbi:YjiH family protein [Kordiimonas aquimaris]|uniref:YjiH family protein n=1 Tax=Kordiimonas aquimaris TaxID=707591 RepID=UPI0021D0543C|nr:YjiH family protein [Kordiimonas aquimaris]